MRKVDLYLTGRVLPGVDAETCARRLAALTGMEPDMTLQMVQGGRLVRIKTGVEALAALKYRETLASLGADVLLRPHGSRQNTATMARTARVVATPVHPAPAHLQRTPASKSPAETHCNRRCLSVPQTHISGLRRGPRSRRSREDWQSMPRVVSASRGWEWFCQSWDMFRGQTGKWFVLFYLSTAVLCLALFVPAVHVLLAILFTPVLLGVHVAGAYWQDQDSLKLRASLKTVAKRWQPLILFGLLTAIFLVLLGALYVFLAGCGAFGVLAASPNALWIFLGVGLIFACLAPLMTSGYFFSIPLLVLGGFRPLRAYQLGVYGSLLNWRAVSIATTVGLLVLIILVLLVHMVLWLMPHLFWLVLTLLLLVLAPPLVVMVVLLSYNACQEIFAGNGY